METPLHREPIFNAPGSVVACLAALAAVHVVLWHLVPDRVASTALQLFAFIPARYSGHANEFLGGWPAAVWTFLTHQLIHGDLMHILLNSAWLLVFGGAIARRSGTLRFLAFGLLGGVAGALTFLVFRFGDPVPMIGASGAVSGLMGGSFRFFFRAMDRGGFAQFRENPRSIPLMSVGEVVRDKRFQLVAGVLVLINLLASLGAAPPASADGIAWQAHLGGFVFGLLTMHLFEPPERKRPNLSIVPPSRPTLH